MGKKPKKSGDRKRKRKKKNSVRNYQESLQLNWYMDGKKKKKKIGNDGKIPWNKES